MIDYGAGLFEALDDPALTALLGTLSGGAPALVLARAVPAEEGAIPVVNLYRTSPVDLGSDLDQTTYSVNCRDVDEAGAEAVAFQALTLLSRKSSAVGGYEFFFIPSALPAVPPSDAQDLWNAPVEVIVKARKP